MPNANSFIAAVGDTNSPITGIQQIINPQGTARIEQRPLDYNQAPLGSSALGHYRAVALSGATNSISAGTSGILASLRWVDATRLFVLTRLAMCLEVTSAITAAAALDAQAFIFGGSTGASTGSGSSTLTLTGRNQKARTSMGTTLLASGEIRTIGTTTALTACTGKTNDGAPFGAAMWGCLFDTSATGVATLVSPGAAITPGGWQDLFVVGPYNHPLVLAQNEGIEIQTITAGPTTGGVKYAFLYEWAEVAYF